MTNPVEELNSLSDEQVAALNKALGQRFLMLIGVKVAVAVALHVAVNQIVKRAQASR